jgi:hypothetical protein
MEEATNPSETHRNKPLPGLVVLPVTASASSLKYYRLGIIINLQFLLALPEGK